MGVISPRWKSISLAPWLPKRMLCLHYFVLQQKCSAVERSLVISPRVRSRRDPCISRVLFAISFGSIIAEMLQVLITADWIYLTDLFYQFKSRVPMRNSLKSTPFWLNVDSPRTRSTVLPLSDDSLRNLCWSSNVGVRVIIVYESLRLSCSTEHFWIRLAAASSLFSRSL